MINLTINRLLYLLIFISINLMSSCNFSKDMDIYPQSLNTDTDSVVTDECLDYYNVTFKVLYALGSNLPQAIQYKYIDRNGVTKTIIGNYDSIVVGYKTVNITICRRCPDKRIEGCGESLTRVSCPCGR